MSNATIDLNLNVHVVRPETNGHSTNGKNGKNGHNEVAAPDYSPWSQESIPVLPATWQEMTPGQVYRTSDLDRFRPEIGQRTPGPSQLRKITTDWEETNEYHWWKPLFVRRDPENPNGFIVPDGNGRLTAARQRKESGQDYQITVIEIPTLTLDQVRRTPVETPWNTEEVKEHYRAQGNPHYERFHALQQEFGVSAATLSNLCFSGYTVSPDRKVGQGPADRFLSLRADFREGRLVFTDEHEASLRSLLTIAREIAGDKPFARSLTYLTAIKSLLRTGFDRERMKKQVGNNSRRVVRCSTKAEYIQMLVEIYNHRNYAHKLNLYP